MEEAKPTGRPTIFTKELADKICEQLALGNSMRTVCKADDMPSMSSVFSWLRTNELFLEQYTRAKEESTDAMAEELLDIVDDGSNDYMERKSAEGDVIGWKENGESVQRSRLRADTRKWLMSKMKPKKYGEKLDLTTNGKDLPTVVGFNYVMPTEPKGEEKQESTENKPIENAENNTNNQANAEATPSVGGTEK